jgi:hypothetical protein
LSATELFARLRAAWIQLRYDHPQIASHTAWGPKGEPLLTYQETKDASDVEAWADRTVRMRDDTTLDELRYELSTRLLPCDGEEAFVYFLPGKVKTRALLRCVWLAVDHDA